MSLDQHDTFFLDGSLCRRKIQIDHSCDRSEINIYNHRVIATLALSFSFCLFFIFFFELSRPGASLVTLVDPFGRTPILVHGIFAFFLLIVGVFEWSFVTRIRLTPDLFSVRYDPIRWPKARDVDAADINAIIVEESPRGDLRFIAKIGMAPKGSNKAFEAKINTKSGNTFLTIRGFSSREAAQHLASTIEEALMISRPGSGFASQP